jgi:ArsR family transcriptional regulator
MNDQPSDASSAQVFDLAAEFFGVLSTPARLRIIGALCSGERNVSHLLEVIKVSQPNMSRHLNVLYKAGLVAKRRSGQQVFYRIADASVVKVCRSVCSQVEIEVNEVRKVNAG